MKKRIIILLICVLPLMLLGANLHSYTPDDAQRGLSPEGDLLLSLQVGVKNLPVRDNDRDRSWRLLQIVHQSDYDEDNVFQLDEQEIIYYNATYTNQADSLVYCQYDSTAFTFVPYKTKKYYYAANGVDIVRVDLSYANDPSVVFNKSVYDYDNQHRLIHQYKYNRDSVNNTYKIAYRYHWVITDNLIAERYIVYFSDTGQPNYFSKTVFYRDAQGRNIGYLQTSSSDSLNWVNKYDCVTNYHPNDTSSGQDQIHYFAHDYVLDFYINMNSFYFFSMISDYTTRIWTDNNWVNSFKTEYNYNNAGQITYYTQYNYIDGWQETNKYTCDYNENNNMSQFSSQTWNAVNNNWNGYQQIHTLTWEEYTGIDDETAPEIASVLTAYPNPFRDKVNISIKHKDNAPYTAGIYNIKGQLVKQFDVQKSRSLVWDGKDESNSLVGNGIYLIKVSQNGRSNTKKIICIKQGM